MMTTSGDETTTILIVDDEASVRQTFVEWLSGAGLSCRILAAADAEAALRQAADHQIDLAILDWNLGAGHDGLQLLQDLREFCSDVAAIMVTGFAHRATPLDAMRMGVRDYLDKNQDLNRGTFLESVGKLLKHIGPAKRERRVRNGLLAFHAALEKALPLVQAATALNDPVPLPSAIRHLFLFLLRMTGAREGVLLVHGYDPQHDPPQIDRVYDHQGQPLPAPSIPFAQSLAGSVISLQDPLALVGLQEVEQGAAFQLHPFERNRASLLAAPLQVHGQLQVVLELFDKEGGAGFTEADRQLVAAAADLGAEMLRQALAERQGQRLLLDAVATARRTAESLAGSLQGEPPPPDEPPPNEILEQLREGWTPSADSALTAEETLRLAEAIRVLSVRNGPAAVRHCLAMVSSLQGMLDEMLGRGDG